MHGPRASPPPPHSHHNIRWGGSLARWCAFSVAVDKSYLHDVRIHFAERRHCVHGKPGHELAGAHVVQLWALVRLHTARNVVAAGWGTHVSKTDDAAVVQIGPDGGLDVFLWPDRAASTS